MKTRSSRAVLTAAFTLTALLASILAAVAAGTGTVTPPPKIAIVAHDTKDADALAVGPTGGILGAPIFTTSGDNLSDVAKAGLIAYAPELVIVLGGTGTLSDTVLTDLSTALGLPIQEVNTHPASGIVRIKGTGRQQTAVAISELIAAYNPAFLPVDATATDSDLLDGLDSTAFLGATAKAADADKLDGMDATAFLGAAAKAADADKLDGLDSAAFAAADLGILYVHVGLTSVSASTTVASLSTPSLPDPCGGNATSHRYLVEATGIAYNGGAQTFGRQNVTLDSTILPLGEGLQGEELERATAVESAQNFASRKRFTNVTPGNHTFRLMADKASGADYSIYYAVLTATYLGYTCP